MLAAVVSCIKPPIQWQQRCFFLVGVSVNVAIRYAIGSVYVCVNPFFVAGVAELVDENYK